MSKSLELEGAQVAAVEVLSELTALEERERHRLELRVQRAFYEAGAALRQLRLKKLYRGTHRTFEEYCYERFGYTRRRPYQLIEAAIIFENLCTIGTQISDLDELTETEKQILPTSERQVRDLIRLSPSMQREVWQQAVVAADGKVPTSRVVKGIVELLTEKPPSYACGFCSIDDVFILTRLSGSERKYNGCWAIASDISGINVKVDVHDGTIQVKPENLKPIDEPDARRQLPLILKRIRRLRDRGLLDRCAYTVLESLGRQTYLTDFEADLLAFVEQRYGIND